ncbi:MAG: small ribosomal subunit Rsm22 family protein [Hyphomicrobiaceae bacterium]
MMFPADVRSRLDQLLEGVSRNDLAARAQRISDRYRRGAPSSAAIRDANDALAYALTRMPATFAATHAALSDLDWAMPSPAPRSLVDLGAGTGAATLAACAVWPTLSHVTLVEANPHFRELAMTLLAPRREATGLTIDIVAADLTKPADAPSIPQADIAVASYVLVEQPFQARSQILDLALDRASRALAIVEPGTPAGFEILRGVRTDAIARGARLLGPCPGEATCPLEGTDWCHFSVRLARSRDHKLLKGADAPFEDERYSFLALTRGPDGTPAIGRVLASPTLDKTGVTMRVCAADGVHEARIPRASKTDFKAARRLDWGDRLPASLAGYLAKAPRRA